MGQFLTDFEKKHRVDFGSRLRDMRKNRSLTLGKVAGVLETSSGRLAMVEKGDRPMPDEWLEPLAHEYGVQLEDLVRMKYWPQLILLPLIAIVNTDQLSRDIIEALEKGLEEGERRELTQFIEELLGGRSGLKRR